MERFSVPTSSSSGSMESEDDRDSSSGNVTDSESVAGESVDGEANLALAEKPQTLGSLNSMSPTEITRGQRKFQNMI